MNLLTDYKLINDTFKSMAETVLINGVEQDCIVSTANLGVQSKFHIASLTSFQQGDLIEYRDKMFMVVEEVSIYRHNKFKASMAHCDYHFETPGKETKIPNGFDKFGKPVYIYITEPSTYEYAVINNLERKMALNGQMPSVQKTLYIDVQETAENQISFAVNKEFDYKDKRIKVVSHDTTNNGRLGLLVVFVAKL